MPTPAKLATDRRVAVLIADGLEEVEALAVVDILFRAGIRADMLAVGESLQVTSSHLISFTCDELLSNVQLSDYELVFLPGGIPGTPNLKACPAVVSEVERRGASGQWLAAICAAPSILAEVGVLQGRRATANPGFMDAIDEGGATSCEDAIVVDGHIITSRGMGTAIDLGLQIVRVLLGEDAVEAVKKGIVYQG
ncbi:DJ-1 family glyoxalase III [Schaalia vaccimaxillae]|uniref:DJ-1 family glyoxalase III n=1 Tax=Schaalia vaccimaxillae TaxID=183916 RepID=UPI0003B43A9D|nr:DJ-1 family glyoxalase III [Schaalia vaccimaxillae]